MFKRIEQIRNEWPNCPYVQALNKQDRACRALFLLLSPIREVCNFNDLPPKLAPPSLPPCHPVLPTSEQTNKQTKIPN